MQNVNMIIQTARALTQNIHTIFSARDVLLQWQNSHENNPNINKTTIGKTRTNDTIEAYGIKRGKTPVLLYGFPDPGEAIGGTTTLTIMHGLLNGNTFLNSLDIAWYFIPCLNLSDQPDNGNTLPSVMRDPKIPEVDWCINNPRPETLALLEFTQTIKPALCFPLHDEYHSAEDLPVYFFRCGEFSEIEKNRLWDICNEFGLTTANGREQVDDSTFMDIRNCSDYPNSTFSVLAKYGKVFCAELSKQSQASPADLVTAQLACILFIISDTL